MPEAMLPPDETARLDALHLLGLLDTAREESFDAFPKLARTMFDVPMAAVSLVAADRQWFKAEEGIGFRQTPRSQSFCAHVILQPDRTLIVEDASRDARFADNPLVLASAGIRFYAGAPIFAPGGQPVGALCILDSAPRQFETARLEGLRLLAQTLTGTLRLHGVLRDLHGMALSDPLTGVCNRAGLNAALLASLEGASSTGLLMLDLDRFKAINDLFGHAGGDAALRAVAQRLTAAAGPGQTVARLGGDEFALLLPDAHTVADLREVAQRVHVALSEEFSIAGSAVPLRTSIGGALARCHGQDAAMLSAAADRALYAAKRAGRGTTRLADTVSQSVSGVSRGGIEETLRAVFAENGANPFRLRYQPFHDARSGDLLGFEALIRLRHGRHETLPAEFIPVAEATGLITGLDRWVLRTACREAASWPEHLTVAVNVSAASLFAAELEGNVTEALAASLLHPRRLKLEITETVMVQDRERARATCLRLRARGIRIALDDFGSGHASLSYVRDLPLDELKIDRTFVTGLRHGGRDAEIVRAIVGLGRALNVNTLAEGVETELQRRVLLDQGVDAMQGFLYARPLTEIETRVYAETTVAGRPSPTAAGRPARRASAMER